MANLGFGRRIRRESGMPPRQSNHRSQGGNRTTGLGGTHLGDRRRLVPPRWRGSDSDDELSRDAAGSEVAEGAGPALLRSRRRRLRPRPGRQGAEAIKARGLVACRCGKRQGVAAGAGRAGVGREAFGSRWVELGSTGGPGRRQGLRRAHS